MNIRLTGLFTLRSPLSHIGESISTTAYLVEEPILQEDGTTTPVFCYSGNAWRGQLRDLAASYMLDALGVTVPLDTFHLLFSGGKIGGEMIIDVGRAKAIREAIPVIALFGGGMTNQIMAGKMRVSNCYPLCVETARMMPDEMLPGCLVSYREMTMEKSFSRKDDSKDGARTSVHLAVPVAGLIEGPEKPERDGPAEQMRMTVELVIAGVQLHTQITLLDVSEVELGAVTAALWSFSRSPHIGGQAGKGHGHARLEYNYIDLDSGETGEFIAIGDAPRAAQIALDAKQAYDAHLKSLYDQMLAHESEQLTALLGTG